LIITEGIVQLAHEMAERRAEPARSPLILFLGEGCARAAHVPSTIDIARAVLRDDSLPTAKYVQGRDRRYNEQVLDAFYEYVGDLSRRERYWLFQRYYAQVPVPLFYQDLVRLIEAGHFLHILTTNIDTLLEQALNGAGLWPDRDYELVSLSASKRHLKPRDPDSPPLEIMVVKLHGDVAKQEAAITPDEIMDFLMRHRTFLEGELSGDMVMVGYEFESEPVTGWLARGYESVWSHEPTLWWVSAERPAWEQLGPIEESRRIQYVDGDGAAPEVFFSRLLYTLEDMAKPGTAGTQESFLQKGKVTDYGAEFSDANYLRQQIRRNQQVLYGLGQRAIPGEKNVQLEAQIEYQRGVVTVLEDQLRGLTENKSRLLEVMYEVRNSAGRSKVDPATIEFLNSQIHTVAQQYDSPRPNQDIVSASVSATLVLTNRLGPKVVDPALSRELASFVPSSPVGRAL